LIDGAEHSGSGTILRYSVALATLLREPLRIRNIRSRRPKPGLRAQHLRAVLSCAEISGGHVQGAEIGAQEIFYEPGKRINPGNYGFDVGTAGSTTLLAFALCIPALFASGACKFSLAGGVFQDFAPSGFHMRECLLPLLEKMGAQIRMEITNPGYFPKGQGKIEVTIQPLTGPLKPLSLLDQGKVDLIRGFSLASHLAEQNVAPRMAEKCKSILENQGFKSDISVHEDSTAVQKGAVLAIRTETDTGAMLGADMAGARGRSSERIGKSVARDLLKDLDTGAAVDRHLADQLIIFAALADGTTEYSIPEVTEHVETNLWLVHKILGAKAGVQGNIVKVHGIGYKP